MVFVLSYALDTRWSRDSVKCVSIHVSFPMIFYNVIRGAMHERAAPQVGLYSFQYVCNIIYVRVVVGSKVAHSLFVPQATSELCAQLQRCFV
jgi:hypothetical protein